jgi:hypothetical protein
MNCRATQRTDFDRCRYFDIQCDAFYLFSLLPRIVALRRGKLLRSIVERFDTPFDI